MDYYLIIITPRPLSHTILNTVLSTPWKVTLNYNIEHTATITAVNCAGESTPFVLTNIQFSELTNYCQKTKCTFCLSEYLLSMKGLNKILLH